MPAKGSVQKGERGRTLAVKTEEWKRLIEPYESRHRNIAHRFFPERSALLVIDMQRFFLEESSHSYLPGARAIIGNVRRLVDSYRRLGRPVIFTRHALLKDEQPGIMGSWWGDVLRDEDELSQIAPELEPRPGERVLRKTRYSAFSGTELEVILSRAKVDQILITGVMTHLCCDTTARDAFVRDFGVFFAIDGTASENDDLHVASLKALTDGFVIPVTTKEVLAWLK